MNMMKNNTDCNDIHAKYRLLFESCTDAVMILEDGYFTDCSPAALTLFELDSIEQFIGLSPRDLSPLYQPDGSQSTEKANLQILKAYEQGKNLFEWKYCTAMGNNFHAEVLLTHRQLGKHNTLQVTVKETTSRRQLENDLIQAKEKAEQANQAKSHFLATMSHEIRTPMNAVLGMTDLLNKTELNGKQQFLAKNAHQAARSLLDILNDILDFSKIEAAELTLINKPFNLKQLLEEIVNLFTEQAVKKKIKLLFSIPAKLTDYISGDALRLRQILVNLISNAIKFTKKGSVTLILRANKKVDEKLEMHFSVIDTGQGIPKDKLSNIFESFTQLNNSTTALNEGTGLGLAISQQLVKLMGGHLEVSSKLGLSTTFSFSVSMNITKQLEMNPIASINSAKTGNPTFIKNHVLLVEDNRLNQFVTRSMLEGLGIEVTVASNGEEALTLFDKPHFDLVLMDVHMPVMNGLQATTAIRKLEAERKISPTPIIALTADVQKTVIDESKLLGMDGYLTKPFSSQELNVLLQKHLPLEVRPLVQSETLNRPKIDQLLALGRRKNENILAQAISIYNEETQEILDNMSQAVQTQDNIALTTSAHSLKSASGSMGGIKLMNLCATLEKVACSTNPEQLDRQHIEQLFNKIKSAATDVVSALEEQKAQQSDVNASTSDKLIPVVNIRSSKCPRILIIDDDSSYRFTAKQILQSEHLIVDEAEFTWQALERAEQYKPDLILLGACPKTHA